MSISVGELRAMGRAIGVTHPAVESEPSVQNSLWPRQPTSFQITRPVLADNERGAWSDISLFAGPNSDSFRSVFISPANGSRHKRLPFWPGILIPQAWLLYRKLYGLAAATVLLPILANMIVPGSSRHVIGGIVVAIGVSGRRVYIWRAKRVIAEIRSEASSEIEARERIASAGGVSKAGGVIGLLIMSAVLFMSIHAHMHAPR